MSRFDFGPLDSEPSSMTEYYRLAVDAEAKGNLVIYTVPADLQTLAYATTVLSRSNGPELAAQRANTRMRREGTYLEAGMPRRVITTARALTNIQLVGREVLLEQLDEVQAAVTADLEAGPSGVLQVGIVPARFVRPMPEGMPPTASFANAEDVGTLTTPQGLFVIGPDGYEVDRRGTAGLRGAEADRRLANFERWAGLAVSGEAALELIEESRQEVLAA